jgi:membrane protease YdiL (CAAX protease family)
MQSATPITTNKIILSCIILATYVLGQFGGKWLSPFYIHLLADLSPVARSVIWNVIYFGLVPLLSTIVIFGFKPLPMVLGLNKGFAKGLGMALVLTLPMFIGYAICSGFTMNISSYNFFFGSISAPFFEEFFFRAFLFGLLYRYAGWGMWPATLLDALVFGLIHISQGDDFASSASVFAATAAGAAWFSWLYKEWGWNLWLVIFLHAFMNLSWMLFEIADNAAGGLWANAFRTITIVISVVWTIRHVKQKEARAQVQAQLDEQIETKEGPK